MAPCRIYAYFYKCIRAASTYWLLDNEARLQLQQESRSPASQLPSQHSTGAVSDLIYCVSRSLVLDQARLSFIGHPFPPPSVYASKYRKELE